MTDSGTPEVKFVYRLTGAGWSEAVLTIGSASSQLSASYLGDALGDLVAAAALLPRAESTIRVSWDEEPGEFRWVLDRTDDQLTVRILWFDELWGSKPDEKGKLLLAVTCSLVAFQRAIAAAAHAVLNEWGGDGYREQWIEHEFPMEALRRLEGAFS